MNDGMYETDEIEKIEKKEEMGENIIIDTDIEEIDIEIDIDDETETDGLEQLEQMTITDDTNEINEIDVESVEKIIEAILFSAGEIVNFADILDIAEDLGITKSDLKEMIFNFAKNYNEKNTGLEVVLAEDNIQLVARAEHIDYIKKVLKSNARQTRSLSKSAFEILAVVAYNQPVTKNYVEQVRGVDCTYMLNSLMERGYVEERGRLELPGKPYVYGTTVKFLSLFGLTDIADLPEIEKFKGGIIGDEEETEARG